MPYSLNWEPSGVTKQFTGFVSKAEYVRSAEQVSAHPDFDSLRFIINDFSDIEGHDIDHAALEALSVIWLGSSVTNPQIRVLVVAANPTLNSVISALSMPPFSNAYRAIVFPAMPYARAWLQLQSPLPPRHGGGRRWSH